MPRVLVADPIADAGIQQLREHAEVEVRLKQSPAALVDAIPDFDALIVRSETRVDEKVIRAGKQLRVIGRAGAGVDNIDVEAATRAGILVVNAPSGNTIAAAEHTMALLLALARHIPQADQAVKAGRWERTRFLGNELRDKVLGVIGLGSIGREVAHRAQAFGMRVIATDPVLSEERASQLNVKLMPLDQLMAEADVITLHVPLTSETHHLLDGRMLGLTKPGVRLLNVARGGIVDESALRAALEDGHVAGAALDVFEQEPPGENPLLSLPQVVTTPHLGASTEEAQISVALEIADQVISVLDGGLPRFALNAPVALPEAMAFLRPFIPVAEGIGRFYAQVGRQPATRFQVEYTGEIGNYDCSLLTAAMLTAFLSRFSAERVNPVNARTVAAAHGITVTEQRAVRATEFANLITLHASGEHGPTRIGGTLLLNEPHIVQFNDFRIDLVPRGTFLMSWHADRPGIIGAIGTLLGKNNINIAEMQVGRDRPRGDAVMILSVDDPIPEPIRAEIRKIPGMADVLTVTL
ncbi:MAG TPA: phosphoglycerate dehydrogenase [Candidatus Acidoferrum sp.]|nr:phosphoglycerate dehydrogenase [Candidatus Acidoferrum sp.]